MSDGCRDWNKRTHAQEIREAAIRVIAHLLKTHEGLTSEQADMQAAVLLNQAAYGVQPSQAPGTKGGM